MVSPGGLSFFGSPLLNRILLEQILPLVLSLPICKAWARYLPNICLFGISLNPGPFTIKEHVVISIMATSSIQDVSPYAVSVTPNGKSCPALFSSSFLATYFRQT